MEGEKSDDEGYGLERRVSPTESIFGNPYSGKWAQNNDVPETALQSEQTIDIEEQNQLNGVPVGQTRTMGGPSLISRSEQDMPDVTSFPSHTHSAAFLGDAKRGHVPSVKLNELAEDSASEDIPLPITPEKNNRWPSAAEHSDSSIVRRIVNNGPGKKTRGPDVMPIGTTPDVVIAPMSVESPEPETPKGKHPPFSDQMAAPSAGTPQGQKQPFFHQRAKEVDLTSTKVVQASALMTLVHIICVLLFAANTYFLPLYYLEDNETGEEAGKITFQEIEIYCNECDESSTLSSQSYLDICGIDDVNAGVTEGFIGDWTTAANMSFVAMLMAVSNVAIISIVLGFFLVKRPTDIIPQALVVFGGAFSLAELFVGLIVPFQTQIGTWDRDKVNDMFALSDFQCENDIFVFSTYGFFTIWIVLGCVLVDIALSYKLFKLVRSW